MQGCLKIQILPQQTSRTPCNRTASFQNTQPGEVRSVPGREHLIIMDIYLIIMILIPKIICKITSLHGQVCLILSIMAIVNYKLTFNDSQYFCLSNIIKCVVIRFSSSLLKIVAMNMCLQLALPFVPALKYFQSRSFHAVLTYILKQYSKVTI